LQLNDIKHSDAIINLLLGPKVYVSFNVINEKIHISRRTFFYTLKKINAYLETQDLDPIQNLKGVGYYLPSETKKGLLQQSRQSSVQTAIFPMKERRILIMLALINKDAVSLQLIQQRFHITHHTAVSDLKNVKVLASQYHLELTTTMSGTRLSGNERNQRDWFLTALSEHSALLNSVLELDPHQSLLISKQLHDLEMSTGNYFSDDTLTIFISFLSWYLHRITVDQKNHLPGDLNNSPTTTDAIYHWATKLLANYHVPVRAEIEFITYLVKSGQFIHINPNNTLAHTMSPIVKQVITRFNDVSGSTIAIDTLEIPLLTHLLSTYYRVKYQITFKQPSLKIIRKQYDELIFFTRLALQPFEHLVHQKLSDEEITLVAIYFGGVLKTNNQAKFSVYVVCSSGIGTSKILYDELHQRYPNIQFSNPMSVFKLKNSELKHVKLIISTIELKDRYPIPTLVVAPLPTKNQWQQIDQSLAKIGIISRPAQAITVTNLMDIISEFARINNPQGLETALTELLAKKQADNKIVATTNLGLKAILPQSHILITNQQFTDWSQAVQLAFDPLATANYITDNYVKSIITSTKKHGPYMVIGNGVMLAHARPADGVNKLGMSLLVLKKPIVIHDESKHQDAPVNIIIGLAPIDAAEHVLALSQLVKKLQQPNWLTNIENAENPTKVYQNFFN